MAYVTLDRYQNLPGQVGAGPWGKQLWWYDGLWLWEDGGWSLIKHEGPSLYSRPTAGWPLFDEIANVYAPPYYYADAFYWNGSAWQSTGGQCNVIQAQKRAWCG